MPQMRQWTPPQWTAATVRLYLIRAPALVVVFYIAAYGISIWKEKARETCVKMTDGIDHG